MINQYLNQPYPLLESKWRLIFFISLFIALFMLVFQPFGLGNFQHQYKTFIITGYGLISFIVLTINLFVVLFFFKKWFNESSWTLKKQILWLIWTIFSIGVGNYLYSAVIFSFWSWLGFFVFQFYTLAVGIIPIVVLTILQQNYMLSQNLKSAHDINANLKHNDETDEKQTICLISDNQKDKLEIKLSDFLYIESTGNYIEVYFIIDNKLDTSILRSTLKRIELQLENYATILKCHRAFLVNINKIMQVKGNSQGLRLVLKNAETEIPVSRNYAKSLKEKLNI